jgi:hypothetical protein
MSIFITFTASVLKSVLSDSHVTMLSFFRLLLHTYLFPTVYVLVTGVFLVKVTDLK